MKIPTIKVWGMMAWTGVGTLLALGVATGLQYNALAADKGNAGSLSSRDYKFVCEAAEGGRMEVSLGQLAQQQGNVQSIRDFGQKMVTDHQKANQDLMQILNQKGVTLPDTMEKDTKRVNHYQSLAGNKFDSEYIKDMVSDHKDTLKLLQTEADKGEDPDVRNWAVKTLPTVQEHLSMAESTEAAVKAMKP